MRCRPYRPTLHAAADEYIVWPPGVTAVHGDGVRFTFGKTSLALANISLIFTKTLGKWHTHIIKQIKMNFLLLCNKVDRSKRYRTINIILRHYRIISISQVSST